MGWKGKKLLNGQCSAVLVAALLCLLTGKAFSDDIYSCADKNGKKRIQSKPCEVSTEELEKAIMENNWQATARPTVSAEDMCPQGNSLCRTFARQRQARADWLNRQQLRLQQERQVRLHQLQAMDTCTVNGGKWLRYRNECMY